MEGPHHKMRREWPQENCGTAKEAPRELRRHSKLRKQRSLRLDQDHDRLPRLGRRPKSISRDLQRLATRTEELFWITVWGDPQSYRSEEESGFAYQLDCTCYKLRRCLENDLPITEEDEAACSLHGSHF